MTNDNYDIVAEKAHVFFDRVGDVYERALPKQKAGEFTLVKELETKPFDGIWFNVNKGQSFRFELKDGNQILDIMMLNQRNPLYESMSQYHTATFQGPVPREGYTFFSTTPFWRPMATIIRDTVNYEALKKKMGPGGKHMFNYNNHRCNEGQLEAGLGIVNPNSCNSNFLKALNEIGGERLMYGHRHGEVFCIFQPTYWILEDGVPIMNYGTSGGCFRRGDYVELIAQQDLTVVVSNCPQGGQTSLKDLTANYSWPVAVKIYDTGIELPDVKPMKSTDPIEYVKQGRPGMVESLRGVPGGPESFDWQEEQSNQ
ncbi:MAG: DUF1989 domain-containing protein [Anaerolineae bacterium]|nr:DUF1989 domain-containing protein [Anaerolineae bacterium]MCO5188853.1 DUF1989 domain-containing protein [Anaerolineae bacterium]MCO5207498.1 DUF1989 domain-containing protein [Anaerolineae bacterium]